MDKNTIIGIILIAGILIIYSIISRPSREEIREAQRVRDSIARVEAQEQEELPEEEVSRETAEAEDAETGDQAFGRDRIETKSPDRELDPTALKKRYGVFAANAQGEDGLVTLENDLMRLDVSRKGGRPYRVELKNYRTWDDKPLILFEGDSNNFSLNFYASNKVISTQNLYFRPRESTDFIRVEKQTRTLTMRLQAGPDAYMDYEYTLKPGEYMLDFNIRMVNMDDIIDENTNFLDFDWQVYAPSFERGRQNENNYTNLFYKHYQDDVEHFRGRSNKETQEEVIGTRLEWVAFKQQFFSSVLRSDGLMSNAKLVADKFEEGPYLKRFHAVIGFPYESAPEYELPFSLYYGPNHYQILKSYGAEMNQLINLGGFISRSISRWVIIPIFNWLNNFIGNYGIIILILTIIIKIVLYPLTHRSYLAQAKMRALKPEIDAINEKFGKEKQMEKQQATMALYKKAGINPMGGCLPMLLQMPILFAMFRFFPTSIELRQEKFLWAEDLSTYDSILDLPFNIPLYGDHVSLFTLLMTVSTIATMRFTNQASMSSSQMPGMKGMMYIMPIMFMLILNNFSAGLTYYYFLANLITFIQNQLSKRLINEEELHARIKAKQNKKTPKKKSRWQQRMVELQKQQRAKAKRR